MQGVSWRAQESSLEAINSPPDLHHSISKRMVPLRTSFSKMSLVTAQDIFGRLGLEMLILEVLLGYIRKGSRRLRVHFPVEEIPGEPDRLPG